MDNRWAELVSPSTQEQTRPIFEDVPEETVTVFHGASGPQ